MSKEWRIKNWDSDDSESKKSPSIDELKEIEREFFKNFSKSDEFRLIYHSYINSDNQGIPFKRHGDNVIPIIQIA